MFDASANVIVFVPLKVDGVPCRMVALLIGCCSTRLMTRFAVVDGFAVREIDALNRLADVESDSSI